MFLKLASQMLFIGYEEWPIIPNDSLLVKAVYRK